MNPLSGMPLGTRAAPVAFGALAVLAALAGCTRMDDAVRTEDSCSACHSPAVMQSEVHRAHLSDLAQNKFVRLSRKAAEVMPGDTVVRGDTIRFATPVDADLSPAERARQRRLLAHGYNCNTCHQGYHHEGLKVNPLLHRDGVRDVVLDESGLPDSLQKQFLIAGDMQYQAVAPNCDNIACHGAGRIVNASTGAGKDGVLWTPRASFGDTLNCNSCHITTARKPSIQRHRCDLCHFNVTLDGAAIHDYSKHINGVIDVREP
jgi:predicted CxxxxCH...CXXCH cytochrome family protein